MKRRSTKKYLLVFVLFTMVMILALVFFMDRNKNIEIKNKTNYLLKDLYNLEEGEYSLKNGLLYKNDYIVSEKKYIEANGKIQIDKYLNVRFLLYFDNKCIKKTYMGKTIVSNKCNPNRNIKVKVNKNNSIVSFISNTKDLEYKISDMDDFKGNWIKDEYTDNIIIKTFNEGTNYIWFKDKEGNLSDVISFEVDCINAVKSEYLSSVFYCSGSTVKLDNMDFVVIKDTNDSITLMKFSPLPEIVSPCLNRESEYCYYTNDNKNTYDWSNSYVNYYLNNEFVQKLSSDTRNKLVSTLICNDIYSNCNGESCVGMSRSEIDKNDYDCVSYTSSKVKLISYNEFNYVYSKAKNKNVLNGNYWAINSYSMDNGSSIQYNGDFYIYENFTHKKDIKPVIKLKK